MESMVSKSPSTTTTPAHDDGDGDAVATAQVTSRLYLHRPEPGAGAMEKDAVLRRIRHRRRANRLRDALHSLLLQAAPEAEKDGERPAWLDDAFTSP